MQKLPTPKRVLERQESRSRHQRGQASGTSGSPKMKMPPQVLKMGDGAFVTDYSSPKPVTT